MDENERIDIRVTLRDELSRPARRLEEALEDVGDEAERTGHKIDDLENKVDDLNKSTKDTTRSSVKFRESVKQTNVEVTRTQRVFRRGKTAVRNLGREFKNQARSVGNFFKGYFRSVTALKDLLFSDMALLIPQVITLLATFGTQLVAALGPMGMLASNIAVLLPMISAFGLSVGVLSMGFRGVGDAVKALRDPATTAAELEAIMADMGPHAREFARALVPIADTFEDIGKATQEALLDGMAAHITALTDIYLPVLAEGLRDTAQQLENVAAYAARAFGNDREVLAFSNVMKDGAENTDRGGRALVELGRVLLYITEAAGPQLTRFLDFVTEKFRGWADTMGGDQAGMLAFFERAGDTAAVFGGAVGDLFRGLRNMTKAAEPLRDAFGGDFANTLERFATWTASEEGMARMEEFFTDMIPNVQAVKDLWSAVWESLSTLGTSETFSTFITDLANNGLPFLTELLVALDEGVTPALVDLSEAFMLAMGDNPTLIVDPLIDVLQALAEIAGFLAPIFAGLSPEVKSVITYMSGLALIGFKLSFVFSALWWVIEKVWKVLGWIWKIFQGVGKAIKWVVGILSKFWSWISRLFPFLSKFNGILRVVRVVMLALSGPIGVVIAIIGLLALAFKWAYDNVDWFREGVDTAWAWIKDTLSSGWEWMKDNVFSKFAPVLESVQNAFSNVVEAIGSLWDGLKSMVADPVNFVIETVYNNGIRKFWNAIADLVGLSSLTLPRVATVAYGGRSAPINSAQRAGAGRTQSTAMASGGVLPGWSPGRDIHDFYSPTAGNLHLSGGEAIMRPEFTRLVGGERGVKQLNSMARGGTLAFANGGVMPGGETPHGNAALDWLGDTWIGQKVQSIASTVSDVIGGVAGFIADPIGGIKKAVLDPAKALLGQITGNGYGQMVGELPVKLVGGLTEKVRKTIDDIFSSGDGGDGPRVGGTGSLRGAQVWTAAAARRIAAAVGAPGMRMDAFNQSMAGDHPQGTAVDFIAGRSTLDAVAAYAAANSGSLGVRYIAWQNRMFRNGAWGPQGRGFGNDPQHRWHVHISFIKTMQNLSDQISGMQSGGRNAASVFDNGGWLMPGQLAMNLSNKPEPVFNDAQWGVFNKMVAAQPQYRGSGSSGDGDRYKINIHIDRVESDVDIEKAVVGAIKKVERERRERR